MPIPLNSIHQAIKDKTITRINQLFDYAPISQWKEAIGFRKGVIERLIEDPKRFAFRHVFHIHQATGIKESTLRRLVEGQKKYNWAMKRAGGRRGESEEL